MNKKHISLELAQSIAEVAKEKGVVLPESEKVWYGEGELEDANFLTKLEIRRESVPAYDCQELGEILPHFEQFKCNPDGSFDESQTHFSVQKRILEGGKSLVFHYETDESETEARGKLLLYLLKNDLLK